jgi:NAD(P)H-dependent FMN reductase
MKVLIIEGSPAEHSFTRILVQAIQASFETRDTSVTFWSLYEKPLPTVMPEYHHNFSATPSQEVRDFGELVKSSDGIILASPLYHGAYSGVLKNALDCLWYDAFKAKPVGLVSHGSSAKHCPQPAEQMMTIVKTLYGYAMQTHICTSKSEFEVNHENQPVAVRSEDIKERIERLVEEMIDFADRRN